MKIETYVLVIKFENNLDIDNLNGYVEYVNRATLIIPYCGKPIDATDVVCAIKNELPKMNDICFNVCTVDEFVRLFNDDVIDSDGTYIAYVYVI